MDLHNPALNTHWLFCLFRRAKNDRHHLECPWACAVLLRVEGDPNGHATMKTAMALLLRSESPRD
eukprot:2102331-Pyramimonas_sp.AAC.1